MADEITDDLKDAQDITKAISELMSGDLQSAADGVGDKVKEIQTALADAQSTGSEVKIEGSTFSNLAKLITESQTALKSTTTDAVNFAESLETAADQQEIINTVSQKSASVAQTQTDLQNQLANTTGLTASKVREIQIEIGELDQIEDFLKSVETSVGATNNLAAAQAAVATQTQQFIDKQNASAISVGNTLKTVKDLDKEVAKVNNTTSSLSGTLSGLNMSGSLEWDTSALDDASGRIKEIQDNISSGDMSANIEITGNNEMEKLMGDLVAAQAAADRLTVLSTDYADQLSSATDQASALKVVQTERGLAEKAIAELQANIPDSTSEVALLERSLAVENAKLAQLPKHSQAYDAQKTIMEAVEKSHIRASNLLKGEQAEIQQLTSFKDDYLGKQEADIKNSTDIQTTLQKVNQETNSLASSSQAYSDELKTTSQSLTQYGDNFRKFSEELGPTFDSAAQGIDSAKDSILGLAGSIPLFGGMIESNLKKPFDEAANIMKDGLGQGMQAFTQTINQGGSATDALSSGFQIMGGAIKKAGAALKAAFSGPFLLIAGILLLIGMAVKRFFDLEAKSLEFRQELGLAASSTKDIESAAADVNREMAGYGVNLDQAYEAATALTKELGSTMLVTKDQIKMVAMMNAGLGISADSAVGVYEVFKNLSGGSSEIAKNLSLTTVALSTAAGVPLDQVMSDIAGASETVYAMSQGTGVELAVAAIEARRLGTNIESISSSMESALDFESSISNEMKMASMLGRHISMDAMRQAAFAGDQVKYMEEQQKVMGKIGDLSKMNMHQRKSIAAAMGMEVGELMKMQTQTKALAALENGTAAQKQALAEYQKQRNAALNGETKSLAEQGMEILKQQQAENVKARMAAAFNKLITELGSVLLPVVESAMNVLVPIITFLIKGVAKLVKVVEFLMQPFIFIANIISAITGNTEGLKKQFDGVGASIFAIGGIILGTLAIFGKGLLSRMVSKIPLVGSAFGKVFDGVEKAGGKLWDTLKGGFMGIFGEDDGSDGWFDSLKDKFTGLFESGDDESEGFFGKLKDKVKGMFGGGGAPEPPGPLKADGTPDMRFKANKEAASPSVPDISDDAVPDVDPAKGDKFKDFIEKFNSIDMKQVIKAAAALVILSAALYITAKALNEFNTVEWSSLVKGTLALGMLIGGLYGLSKVLDKTKGSLIKGAAALLIMGLALVPIAYAFNMLSSVDFVSVLLAGIAIAGFAIMAAVLGNFAPYIIAGSIALAILGAALIPAAIAFQIFSSVDWGSVFLGILAIGVLAVMAGLMGAFAPLIIAGAVAIAILGFALIPFAIAALIAGVGMILIGAGLMMMSYGLSSITPDQIGTLLALGLAIFTFALLAPVVLFAGAAMLIFSVALALAAIGVGLFGFAMGFVIDTLKQLPAATFGLIYFGVAVAMLAPLTPLILLTAAAFAILGIALIPLAIASIIAGIGLALIGWGIATIKEADAESVIGSLIGAVIMMGMALPYIILGAFAMGIMTVALIPFSIALMVAGIGMTLFGFGLNLTAEALVKLGDGAKYLIGLAIAISFIGLMIPFIILGAAAMMIMAPALLYLGVAAMIAGVGIMAIGVGMDLMAGAIDKLDVGKLLALVITFSLMGAMLPLIFLGAIAMGIMTTALIPFGIAALVAGAGLYVFASAFEIMADAMSKVPENAGTMLIGIGIGMLVIGASAFAAIFAAAALVIFSVGLLAFGTAAGVAAVAIDILSKGMALLALSLSYISDYGLPAIAGLMLLGIVSPLLLVAAVAVTALILPTLAFAMAAMFAAPAVWMLSVAFDMLATSLSAIGEQGALIILSLAGLGLLAPLLLGASIGIMAIAGSLFGLALGLMFLDEDDVAILKTLGESMANIGKGVADMDISSFTEALSSMVDDTFLSGIYLLGDAILYLGQALSQLPTDKMELFVEMGSALNMSAAEPGASDIGGGATTSGTESSVALAVSPPDQEAEGGGFLGGLFGELFGGEDKTAEASTVIHTQQANVMSEGGGIDAPSEKEATSLGTTSSVGLEVSPPEQEADSGGFLSGLFSGLFGGEDKTAEASTVIQTQKAIVISEGGGTDAPQDQIEMEATSVAGGGEDIRQIIAEIVKVPAQQAAGGSSDNSGVEAKLDELIGLLKSGKIGVNMDGKKVESQLAKVAP